MTQTLLYKRRWEISVNREIYETCSNNERKSVPSADLCRYQKFTPYTERRGLMIYTPVLYSRDAGFNSRPRDRL
jgi:hypothetical protein